MGRKAELLIVTALAIATPAHAADRQTISIAPSRLGEAVVALGRQTGVSVGMSDQSLAGIATPAVKGRLSVDAALKRLLRGSGARAMMIDASTWRIVRARPVATAQTPARAPAAPLPDQPVAEIIVTASKRYTPLPRYAGMVEAIDANLFSSGEASGGTATLLARVASLSSTHAGNGPQTL